MRIPAIARVTCVLLALFSLVMALPAIVALLYDEQSSKGFALPFAITLVAGRLLIAIGRVRHDSLRSGDGFLVTVLFYAGLGLFGAVPRYRCTSMTIWTSASPMRRSSPCQD